MATSLLQLAYRPLRICMLIRPLDEDLREAISINSALWGGVHNPLVAVDRSERRVDAQLAGVRFDGLHPVVERAGLRRVIERQPHLDWPRFDGLVREASYDAALAAVDVRAPLNHVAEQLERGRQPGSGAILPVWDERDRFAMVYAATFGDVLGAEKYIPGLRERYLHLTGAQEVPAETAARAYRHQRVPLDVTRVLIDQTTSPYLAFDEWAGVFAGDPTSVSDVREYWNLRARGIDVVFWDVDSGGPFQDVVAADVAAARTADVGQGDDRESWYPCFLPVGPMRDRRDHTIPEGLRAAVEPHLRPVPRHDLGSGYRDHAERLRTTETQQVVVHSDDWGADRSRVVVPLTTPPFRRHVGSMMQSWVVVLSTYGDRGYRGTLNLPHLTDLNPWYDREVGAMSGLRVEPGALGVITGRYDPSLDLTPIPLPHLLRRVLERAEVSATANASGEAARHLISQLGGWNALRVLRIPGVRRLLSRNDALSGLSRNQARDAIRDQGSFETADPFYVAGHRLDSPQAVFEFLLRRQVFLAGLEIGCPQCLHNSVYAPRELGDTVRCPKCSFEFLLAPALQRDQWRFRLSGLLENRAHRVATQHAESQPEAIPVLLTLLFMSDRMAPANGGLIVEPNHDLRGPDIADCESDFLALLYGDRQGAGRPHCFVGECKGRGEVTEDDVTKLTRVVEVLRESGIAADMVFSTTRQFFTEAEMALFRDYFESQRAPHPSLRRPPLLLTGTDLDSGPYGPRATFRTHDFLQHGTFGALIEATRQRYFAEAS